MSSRITEALGRASAGLRHEPIHKRIRATLGSDTVVDTTRATLVWQPRRVVPSYAVPAEEIRSELVPEGAAVRPDDPDLAGLVILDFNAFDAWYEEDEPNVAHPRDPFHRIDILHSSREIRVERDGHVLAESDRPCLLFETGLPMRAYLPREDVRVPLEPSDKQTFCAYKGQASYWTPVAGERRYADLVWSYEAPLREAAEITGMVAFFNEHVDLSIDGERQERPVTPWS